MTVYLINDTDAPLPGVIGELRKPVTQVKVGGLWLCDEPMFVGCGSVPEPRDLEPRSTLALRGWHEREGIPCLRRFLFRVDETLTVVSDPIPGFVRLETLETSLAENSADRLRQDFDRCLVPDQWKRGTYAKSPEEFAALLELARHHEQCISLRKALLKWMVRESRNGHPPAHLQIAIQSMVDTLGKPWLHSHDGQALADRAIEALRSTDAGKYGTPEKCKAAVWRYLSYPRLDLSSNSFRSESSPPDGRPLSELARLADQTIRTSKDPAETEAAAGYLSSWSVAEDHLSSTVFRGYLASGRPLLIITALEVLARRGHREEMGLWLSTNIESLGACAARAYSAVIRGSYGEKTPWEFQIIGKLLSVDPYHTLILDIGGFPRIPPDKIPEAWCDSLRHLLRSELAESETSWWASGDEVNEAGPTAIPPHERVEAIANALRTLGHWRDDDRGLFRSYLSYPAYVFQEEGKGFGKRRYLPRIEAKNALVKWNETTPSDLKTEELIVYSASEPSEAPAVPTFLSNHSTLWIALATGLAGLAIGYRVKLAKCR